MSEQATQAEDAVAEETKLQLIPSPQVLVSSLRQLMGAQDPYGGYAEVCKTFEMVNKHFESLDAAVKNHDFMAIRISLSNLIFDAVGMTIAAGCNFDKEMQATAHIRESIFDLTEEQANATADEYRKFGIESRIDEVVLAEGAKPSFYRIFAVLPAEVSSIQITSGPFSGETIVDGKFLRSLRSVAPTNPYLPPRELFLRQMGYAYDKEKAEAELNEYRKTLAPRVADGLTAEIQEAPASN